MDSTFQAGFARRKINPPKGISLVGYFNPRPNQGVMDDLCVKVLLLAEGKEVAGIISYDLCFLSDALVKLVRDGLRTSGVHFADRIPLSATHTHTGPDIGGIFGPDAGDKAYLQRVVNETVAAVKEALAQMAPAELRSGAVTDNPFAFNRRFWMEDGTVVTNPGKGNPKVVKPEGTVDREVSLLAAYREGKPYCIVANICNHTDTTSGDLVSADWPGHMERAVQEQLGRPTPVMTLIAPAGNVNHVDIHNPDQPVYGLDESKRTGRGYAEILLRTLGQAKPIGPAPMKLTIRRVTVGKRVFTPEQMEKARRTLAADVKGRKSGDLTSEDIARGSGEVERFFAQQLLAYSAQMPDAGRPFDLAALTFGKEVAIVFLPGEPFTEIGLSIKKASPFRRTLVASLANGECGYVALKECFSRGGYEVLPVVGGGPREDTAELLIAEAGKLLAR